MGALEYYVETYDIKYVSTVDTFTTVVGVFFDFIASSYGWKNPLFETRSKNMELKAAYDQKITELKLNKKKQVEPLTDEEAIKLLNLCNDIIDNAISEKILNGASNGDFSAYISALISKLVLLYGTKNGSVNDLVISDYDSKLHKLRINGFWIHLPDKFAVQMSNYMTIREKILGDEKEQRLFVDIRKKKENWIIPKCFIF